MWSMETWQRKAGLQTGVYDLLKIHFRVSRRLFIWGGYTVSVVTLFLFCRCYLSWIFYHDILFRYFLAHALARPMSYPGSVKLLQAAMGTVLHFMIIYCTTGIANTAWYVHSRYLLSKIKNVVFWQVETESITLLVFSKLIQWFKLF